MGSGNLLGASSRLGSSGYKPELDLQRKLKMKRNREVEADMISDVKVEAALKMKKLLLLGDYDNEFMAFRRILNAKSLRNMCTKGLQWATDVFLAVSFLFWD